MTVQMEDMFATRPAAPPRRSRRLRSAARAFQVCIEIAVERLDLRRIDPLQELVHGAHHIRMGVERAAGEADVGGAVVAKALHEITAAAHHADRQAAAQRLAVGDHVGLHAEILLRAARREPEPDKHLVEDQHDVALGAHLAQALQPLRIGCAVEGGLRAAVDQRRNPPARSRSGCSACSGLTSTQAMLRAGPQHAQRVVGHVLQRIGVARRNRIADARLHVAPPAVVGAAEAHEAGAAACGSGRAEPPASPPRFPTCGTRPRRARKSRAAA